MTDPILRPIDTIDAQTLHIKASCLFIQSGSRDVHESAISHTQIEVCEPRTQDQIDGLRDDWIQPDEIPDQVGVDGAGVGVSRKSRGLVGIVQVHGLAASKHGFELSASGEVVVEEGSGEAGFVAWVEERGADAISTTGSDGAGAEVGDEHGVETRFGGDGSAHELDQRGHVEWNGPAVFPW